MQNQGSTPPFIHTLDQRGILYIKPSGMNTREHSGYLNRSIEFLEILLSQLVLEHVKGIIYELPFYPSETDYKLLLQEAIEDDQYEQKLSLLLTKVYQLKKQDKPVIALVDAECSAINLSIALWAQNSFLLSDVHVSFPESKLGLLPTFGAISHVVSKMQITDAFSFLTQGKRLSASEAVKLGLFTKTVSNKKEALRESEKIALTSSNKKTGFPISETTKDSYRELALGIQKRTNNLIPGTDACVLLIGLALTQNDSLIIAEEARCYTEVLRSKESLAILRTQYYGIRNAKTLDDSSSYVLKRLGVLGAGMMGAGIAFEAARAEVEVFLKDVTLEVALKGKSYADQVSSKLVQQGRMDDRQKEQLLARIHPIADTQYLQNLDLVIEAVFEDRSLKNTVTQETISSLREGGFFASNTTSLPISSLASVVDHPESFIGMHFFSPVDRMALVEIIRGKNTDDNTTSKALQVARQLGKVPIVVNDGPAFFTSRIFFNYLLEAITMLLEGIPASSIEEEARKAGFAVGPLAVLDEISLGLMLHVYQQLPSLTNSQQKAYAYLESLVASGRNGRRTNQGFYNYSEGRKEIWQDPTLSDSETGHPKETIQKRLLHVMALDSYRCLAEGVLNQPIDGDIGSILGIGYPPHTGGVFGHIDQTGLQEFVEECTSFTEKGEQWEVPLSLQKLAEDNFTFYNGFDSNWK